MSRPPQYRFLVNEGDLMRMNEGMRTEVWQPGRDGEPGRWSRYQLDVFNDSYSIIGPGHAQQLAPDADLYADALPLPPGKPVPGSGAHERARAGSRETQLTATPHDAWPEHWVDPDTGERLTTTAKFRRGAYAKPLGYYEYDTNAELRCWNCGWTGRAGDGSRDSHDDLFDVSCPRCETMLLIVSTLVSRNETERAAAAGHPGAQRELARMQEVEVRSGDAGPWWVPGAPVTFAGGERERAWKDLVLAHVPQAPDRTSEQGLAIEFAIPDPRKQDLDNLAEPVLSVVVNKRGWLGGRRPNLRWLALRRRQALPLGCRISPLAEPPADWLPTGAPLVRDTYTGGSPASATAGEFAAWLAQRCEPGRDARYAVAFSFADRLNLGEVATGKVKPFIDCMWPLLGGPAGKPQDWRIDDLMLARDCEDVTAGAVAVTIWSL